MQMTITSVVEVVLVVTDVIKLINEEVFKMPDYSPMMKQYWGIKNQYKDAIVFFRLGDFYEMFYDDAKIVSSELDLTLTAKDCGQDEKAPMCGIPFHSCETYIARLIANGYKVAMCDQMEEPSKAKGLVKREVVRVITPGTVMEASMLDEAKNNYICSVFIMSGVAGICFCDVSTGELKATEVSDKDIARQIQNELGRFCPREILVGGKISLLEPIKGFIKDKLACNVEFPDEQSFDTEFAKEKIIKHFGEDILRRKSMDGRDLIIRCIGALLTYLESTQKTGMERINKIEFYNETEYMGLDLNTIRNLELVETMRNKEKRGSLLWVLDKTRTAMGKRLMRAWIERPLMDCDKICKRQDAIEEIYSDVMLKDKLLDLLTGMSDIERLVTRVTYGSANGRDLKSLSSTISKLPQIRKALLGKNSYILKDICSNMDDLRDVYGLIESAIVDEPPFSIREGGIIKDGYDSEIDEIRKDMSGGKGIIASIEANERQKTGIPKLKVGYNRVMGYYIEVTNSYKKLVPAEYVRKQTLTGCERYITRELKELESRVLSAKERCVEAESRVFDEVRKKVSEQLVRISSSASLVALLDVLRALADVAARNDFKRPEINSERTILLKESRHPVVEAILTSAPFVPNNVLLDNDDNMVAIITGPNMAGKSTYMRQTALIVLMAQMGSFVPAGYAKIGIVDSIFTRIGASDDLASGQSTFMVEMNEVAQIMRNATNRSLLILDEIGRGTSTFDGMSIARAVLEYIVDKSKLGAKTLFATHYHELTSIGDNYKGIKNYNIAVKKRGDDITFLRRIVPGGADDSYGIEVAKLAGLPDFIISRAKQVLKEIESGGEIPAVIEKSDNSVDVSDEEKSVAEEIIKKLKNTDVTVLNPIEAMNILFQLVKMVNG